MSLKLEQTNRVLNELSCDDETELYLLKILSS